MTSNLLTAAAPAQGENLFHARLSWQVAVGLAVASSLLGVLSFYSTASWLWNVWRTDDLKSIGLVVPFLSFFLILRAWRSLGWQTPGSWWGFAVLFGTVALVFLRDQTMLVLTVGKAGSCSCPRSRCLPFCTR